MAGYLDRRVERRKLLGTLVEGLGGSSGVVEGDSLGGLGARRAVDREIILGDRRSVGNIVKAKLQAGDGADVNLGAVELDNLNLEAAGDGIGDLGRRAGTEKLRGVRGLVSREGTVDDTRSRLSHDDKTTNELAGDVDVDLSRTLNLGDIELDVSEVTGGLDIGTLRQITAARTAAIELVDGALGRARELAARHAPVLKSSIGVTEVPDAVDRVGGVEVAPGFVEGVER